MRYQLKGMPTYSVKIEPENFVVIKTEKIALLGLTRLLDCDDTEIMALTPKLVEKCVGIIVDIQRKKEEKGDHSPKNKLVIGSPGYRALAQVRAQSYRT